MNQQRTRRGRDHVAVAVVVAMVVLVVIVVRCITVQNLSLPAGWGYPGHSKRITVSTAVKRFLTSALLSCAPLGRPFRLDPTVPMDMLTAPAMYRTTAIIAIIILGP